MRPEGVQLSGQGQHAGESLALPFAIVALAAKYHSMNPIWMGTTADMMVADAFGIIVVVALGKKTPERFVKWFAAAIFIFFGVAGLYATLSQSLLTPPLIAGGLLLIVLLIGLFVHVDRHRKSHWNKVGQISHGERKHHEWNRKEVE
jgi:hypothetical protein